MTAEAYAVPSGRWFSVVSSPHYTFEIVIYASLWLAIGPSSHPAGVRMLHAPSKSHRCATPVLSCGTWRATGLDEYTYNVLPGEQRNRSAPILAFARRAGSDPSALTGLGSEMAAPMVLFARALSRREGYHYSRRPSTLRYPHQSHTHGTEQSSRTTRGAERGLSRFCFDTGP